MERPDWSLVTGMFEEVKQAWAGINDTQKRMLQITGVAWSPDRMVKAVVGPRGQLMELEIDPRILRKPDSRALAATIVATTQKAVEDAARQSKEILDEKLPSDLRGLVGEQVGVGKWLHTTDAGVQEELRKDDDQPR